MFAALGGGSDGIHVESRARLGETSVRHRRVAMGAELGVTLRSALEGIDDARCDRCMTRIDGRGDERARARDVRSGLQAQIVAR